MGSWVEVRCPVEGCTTVRRFRPASDHGAEAAAARLSARLRRQHPHEQVGLPLATALAGVDLGRLFGVPPIAVDMGRLFPQWSQVAASIAATALPAYSAWQRQVLAVAANPAWEVISAQLAQRIQAILKPVAAGAVDLSWIADLIRGLEADNWGDLTVEEVTDLAALAEITGQGIAVAWVPRAEVLSKLMAADADGRADVLLACEADILDDCAAAVAVLDGGPLAEPAQLLGEAVGSARAGYHGPAQALAANVLDTVLRVAFPLGAWQGYRRVREAIAEVQSRRALKHLRLGLALAPVLLAMTEFHGGRDPIPGFYNRHATAHFVSRVQYNRLNALLAVMAAASVLRESHEALAAQEPDTG